MTDWLTAKLEEYKSLRTESLTAMQTQQSVLRLGMAALAALVIAGLRFWDDPNDSTASAILFLLFVPLTTYMVLIIWLGEVARMMRAGAFLIQVEHEVNEEIAGQRIPYPERHSRCHEADRGRSSDPALRWEQWLRGGDSGDDAPQLKWNYMAVISLFMLAAIASIILGHVALPEDLRSSVLAWILIDLGEATAFSLVTTFVFIIGRRFK